jgi:hypothetical protein
MKTKILIKTIKKVLPHVRNRSLSRELMYRTLQVIEEMKNLKEEDDDKPTDKA